MTMLSIMTMVAAMVAAGLAGGVIAGLLGVGGGIVLVPVLDSILGVVGVDPAVRMHVAVATSLATIVPTSISSSRAHDRRGGVDHALARRWAVAMALGAVAGTITAGYVSGKALSAVFAVVAALVALKMLLPLADWRLTDSVPDNRRTQLVPFTIGSISSMMGIGGGTLSVPTMTIMGQDVHRAVGTAAIFGLLISVPGTIGYVVTGWGDPRLPAGSLGYVNLIGLALIAPTTWIAAPWGAAIAHRLSKRALTFAFGAFLAVVAARMAWRVLAG